MVENPISVKTDKPFDWHLHNTRLVLTSSFEVNT